MTDPGLPLTTGEGNTASRCEEIRELCVRWMTVPNLPDNAIPASPDDVMWLLAEYGRLRERLADTETEKIERGTEILRLREELRIREESQIPVIPRAAKARMDAAEAERDALREQLDAELTAIHGLVYEHVATTEGRLAFGHEIARARAALGVEGRG